MSIELENIDCNCNNCIFMIRDINKWQKWHDYHKDLELNTFNIKKEKAIKDSNGDSNLLKIANSLVFQFEKKFLINYGNCTKLNKPVSFIPGICQIETQLCFKNRKQAK